MRQPRRRSRVTGGSTRTGGAETVTSTVYDLTGRSPVSFEQFVRDHRAVFA